MYIQINARRCNEKPAAFNATILIEKDFLGAISTGAAIKSATQFKIVYISILTRHHQLLYFVLATPICHISIIFFERNSCVKGQFINVQFAISIHLKMLIWYFKLSFISLQIQILQFHECIKLIDEMNETNQTNLIRLSYDAFLLETA